MTRQCNNWQGSVLFAACSISKRSFAHTELGFVPWPFCTGEAPAALIFLWQLHRLQITRGPAGWPEQLCLPVVWFSLWVISELESQKYTAPAIRSHGCHISARPSRARGVYLCWSTISGMAWACDHPVGTALGCPPVHAAICCRCSWVFGSCKKSCN